MSGRAKRVVLYMETCGEHVRKLVAARAPASPGGVNVTEEEWQEIVDHATAHVLRGAHELVLLDQVAHNISVRGLDYVVEAQLHLGIEKGRRYDVMRFYGHVGPRGGARTKSEAPERLQLVGGQVKR